jgi:hypothetical protein
VESVVTGNGLKDIVSAQSAAGKGGEHSSPIHIAPDMGLLEDEFRKRGIAV